MPSARAPFQRAKEVPTETAETERDLVLRCVALAEKGRLTAHPNPPVGAVVLDAQGTPVGEGFHRRPGTPHAEALALSEAGSRARGGTLYCTLEPCSHTNLTPPCADAILEAGIARVVFAVYDPDPRVRGSGAERLLAGGVDVEAGVAEAEATEQIRDYLHHRRTGLPWVVLKAARSIEGLQAAADGSSKWITGEESRADAQRLRAAADAVMVGSGTVLADEPLLTCRMAGYDGAQPLRVVMDRRGRVPSNARCLGKGSVVYRAALKDALVDLGERGVVRLLVEGGPTLAAAFTSEGLVDEYVSYIGPLALAGAATLADGHRLRVCDVEAMGDDVRITWKAGR